MNRLFMVATLLAGLAVALQPATPAYAATLTVTTSNDVVGADGQCSLREAINNANANADTTGGECVNTGGPYGNDIITFGAATNGVPIVLAGVAGEDGNAGGDLDILAAGGDLTIQGNGAANTIIDGNNNDRVFHVCPGGACANTVTFSGVTIRSGNANLGGGIYNATTTVRVEASTVSANTAFAGGGIYNNATLNVQNGSVIGGAGAANTATWDGGGIYNSVGTTTVDASTVSANTATNDGGGIYNLAALNVQNGSLIGGAGAANTTTNFGGGIYNAGGGTTTTVDASTVSANTAGGDGGGVYNGGTLNVQNGSVIGGAGAANTATNGGGIYSWAGTTTVDASTVSANTATNDGGGISNEATLNVQNGSTIGGAGAGNQANNDGGGIWNQAGTTTVDASTVISNTATTNGGGIYNNATLNVQNGSTIGGAGVGNQAFDGGGILNDSGGTVTVDASTVSANTATFGGGITNRATLNVQNGSTIGGAGAGNAAGTGGGIDNYAGTATLDGSAVSANRAIWGGGICNNATLNVQNGSTIGGAGAGNQAGWMGGGIFNTRLGTTTVTGSRILNNTADVPSWGGGVYNDANAAGAASVTGSCIVGNSAMSFFNNQTAQQIATGNWWGAATGPNTPGADTVSGNVDASGFLAAPPIPGCSRPIYLPIVWATFH